jgi:hypothetical protein
MGASEESWSRWASCWPGSTSTSLLPAGRISGRPFGLLHHGQPRLSLELVGAYGLEPSPPVIASLTGYCLLHEFGTLNDFLERFPVDGPQAFYEALWGREPCLPVRV